MAIRGIRRIEADVPRHKANQAMNAGICVSRGLGLASDADTRLIAVVPSTSGDATVVGILLDEVVARPAEAEDSTNSTLQGIKSDWIFTASTPLFQEAGNRYVGEEVGIMRRGLITTDRIQGTPSGGMRAWSTVNGYLSAGATGLGMPVGVWQTTVDADGYAEIYFDANNCAVYIAS
jgi:hypothetical protein